MSDPLVEVTGLGRDFKVRAGRLQRVVGLASAVDSVDLTLGSGEILAVLGEPGSGKTTLLRLLVRLLDPTQGSIRFRGSDVTKVSARDLRSLRCHLQVTFQDPETVFGSLRPVSEVLLEPFVAQGEGAAADAATLLRRVDLGADLAEKTMGEVNRDEAQRIGLARALALQPELIALDEPFASLDRAQRINFSALLQELLVSTGTSFVVSTHRVDHVRDLVSRDLVSRDLSGGTEGRVCVMYSGRLVEIGMASAVLDQPAHPYTLALISAQSGSRPLTDLLEGDVPSAIASPGGCRFHTRCPDAVQRCSTESPQMRPIAGPAEAPLDHEAACIFV